MNRDGRLRAHFCPHGQSCELDRCGDCRAAADRREPAATSRVAATYAVNRADQQAAFSNRKGSASL
jgi:hypothetical protein